MNLICLEVILLYLLAASCLGAVELYMSTMIEQWLLNVNN